jgi:20S proteasome subunit alpha 3
MRFKHFFLSKISFDLTLICIGVVLAAEKKEASKLFIPTKESGKLYKMDDHILCSVSGVVADANFLIDYGRLQCQRHLYSHHEPMYVEELVKFLCNYKHGYTQFGSSRPFGVSFMYAGYDTVRGYQLFCSDPSGNFGSWKAHATGKGSVNAISTLKTEYAQDCTLKEALILAAKVLGKSMDTTTPDANKFEIQIITKNDEGVLIQRRVEGQELNKILEEAKVFEENKK